jgi:Excreted virulence factor EspC, type VII ESX diderm
MGDRGPSLIQRGVGGQSDIVVDTDALRGAAGAFSSLGEAFGQGAAGFLARAHLGRTAFGSLPMAEEPGRQYLQSLTEAQAALQNVASQVTEIAARLRQSAGNYDGADVAGAGQPG